MEPLRQIKLHLLVVFLYSLCLAIRQSSSNRTEILSNPFHLSWTAATNSTTNSTSRFDFIFSLQANLKNDTKLESVSTTDLSSASLSHCGGHSACLLKDGKFIRSYQLNDTLPNRTLFKSMGPDAISSRCNVTVYHHCSTHWNPPAHFTKSGCNHVIEWHSPYSCHENATNYERPCYIYNHDGRLIDLTPWVLSNGSSYLVDMDSTISTEQHDSNLTIKSFRLNVCNEAHEHCGPHISSCYINDNGMVETGFTNMTSIKYEAKEKTVLLTSLGQYNGQCPDQRVKTVVRFTCREKVILHARPKLIRSGACENIIEWPTIHACPVSETKVSADKCAIKYEPLGIDINLKSIIQDSTTFKVPNITLGGKQKIMMLGLCSGIHSTKLACEGKLTSTTTACLYDADSESLTKTANNSEIVGSFVKSTIRLADNRLYLESFAPNKTCNVPMGPYFNASKQVGTRIEFFCSQTDDKKPTFLGYEDCTYLFEWGSRHMCLESLAEKVELPKIGGSVAKQPQEISRPADRTSNLNSSSPAQLSDKDLKIDLEDKTKSAKEMHSETVDNAKKMIDSHEADKIPHKEPDEGQKNGDKHHTVTPVASNIATPKAAPVKETATPVPIQPPTGRMNKLHKFFMIGLIVMSLGAFIVIIFVLDRKTRLKLPLGNIRRQARQALNQQQPVPYNRLGQFNDSLDL